MNGDKGRKVTGQRPLGVGVSCCNTTVVTHFGDANCIVCTSQCVLYGL